MRALAVAEMNVLTTRPAYHFSIAWGKEDKPTQQQMVKCVGEAIDTLGLSISKKIIEDHRGRIYTRSEPGRGAIFVFHLPLQGA